MNGNYKRGEIYLVDFDPGKGHEFQKQRPAVIIQSDKTIIRTSLITVMAVTSNIRGKRPGDIQIKKDRQNNLYTDSIAKAQAIHAFDKTRFMKKIGLLNPEKMEEIKSYLKIHFDI